MRTRQVRFAAALLALAAAAPAASRAAAGPALGPQLQVNASAVDVQANPRVAVFPDGGFVVVWEAAGKAGSGRQKVVLHARLFGASGAPAGGEFLLVGASGSTALDGVAAAGNGSFVVAWDLNVDAVPRTRVFVQRFSRAGKALTPPVQAHDDSTSDRYFGALAVGTTGRVAVLWAADVGSAFDQTYRNDAFVRVFSRNLVPLTGELQVAMGDVADGSGPFPDALAMAADGSLTAVMTYAGDSVDVFVQRIAPDGTLLDTDSIFPPDNCCAGNTYDASLAMAPDGRIAVAWDYQRPATLDRLPLALTPPSGISGRMYGADGKAQGNPLLRINRRSLGQRVTPALACLPAGGCIAAWEDESARDGSGSGIFGRLLAADGTPAGPDFLVNGTTSGNQISPAIGAGPGGTVVVWVSGPASTIYARRVNGSPATAGADGSPP
ncbi:MAG TPA: hypothetical protein VE075_06545 [Thermoanaerobaculia bacterium]|nr:hypothetical protein [Thermoanaerobaculia bacterium]